MGLTMETENQAALLKGKTREFENLPANILGLDGWLLQVVPKPFRNQFLSGYEKLLRIAMHPDRVPLPEAKAARESYLQSVSESIAYLQSGELEYELATDQVPRRQNFVVQLRKREAMHRGAATRASNLKREAQEELVRIRRMQQQLRTAAARLNRETTGARGSMDAQIRDLHDGFRRQAPVAVNLPTCQISGWMIDFKRWTMTTAEAAFIEELTAWAGEMKRVPRPGTMGRSQAMNLLQQAAATEPTRILCHRSIARTVDNARLRILGSMSLVALVQYLRAWFRYPTKRPSRWSVLKRLKGMDVPPKEYFQTLQTHAYAPFIQDYIWPYLLIGELAVVRPTAEPHYEFMLVKGIGY